MGAHFHFAYLGHIPRLSGLCVCQYFQYWNLWVVSAFHCKSFYNYNIFIPHILKHSSH